MSAYYNEFDPKAAATLRELIAEKLIAPGDVDERSIEDVYPSDLTGYSQVHLFAGFGIWSLAFRMAGWPDSRPVWSASCPCQPFSAAGKGGGFADERHLWPAAFWLLQHGKRHHVPAYGEQVASPDGMQWLDLVRADLERIDLSCWSTVLASAGVGAPIIRQRTYWMAFAKHSEWWAEQQEYGHSHGRNGSRGCGNLSGMACSEYERSSCTRRNSQSQGTFQQSRHVSGEDSSTEERPGPVNGFWRAADWLQCRDAKWRPVEPGTFPLAHGYPERMGILRGAGNAISPQVAAAWIRSTM